MECAQAPLYYDLLQEELKRKKKKKKMEFQKLGRENHSFNFGSDVQLLGKQHC